MVVNPYFGADNPQPDLARDLLEAHRELGKGFAGRVHIAGLQLVVPAVLALALEAQQGMIRRSTLLDGVVRNGRLFLGVNDRQQRGVAIEDQPRRGPRSSHYAVQQAIVQPADVGQCQRGHAKQKSSERGGFRIAGQASEVLKHAVPPEHGDNLARFDSEDHRTQQRQQNFPEGVTVVWLSHWHLKSQRVFEAGPPYEPMRKIDAPVGGQRGGAKFDHELPRSTGHYCQSYRDITFGCKNLYFLQSAGQQGPLTTSRRTQDEYYSIF